MKIQRNLTHKKLLSLTPCYARLWKDSLYRIFEMEGELIYINVTSNEYSILNYSDIWTVLAPDHHYIKPWLK